ncbi:hypothetical protein D3C80_1070930 [compost metagenome]
MISLINSKAEWTAANWEDFFNGWYSSVFNLKTANLFGCVVWAIILDIPISLVFTPPAGPTPFGFGVYRENFNNSNFFGAGAVSALTLDEARRLLRVRYYAQTMSPNVTNINGMLQDVFGDLGLAYIQETVGGLAVAPFGFGQYRNNFFGPSNFNSNNMAVNILPMNQKYIFTFPLSAGFKAALNTYLPRGSAVKSTIVSP